MFQEKSKAYQKYAHLAVNAVWEKFQKMMKVKGHALANG